MDHLSRYRELIRQVLEGYASWHRTADGKVRCDIHHDPSHDSFFLIECGWEGRRRMHGMIFHLELIDGQVWVQWDSTDRPIARELHRAGIPREDIVLGEKLPELWPYTDYGVPRGAAQTTRA